jgi:hypothetical protein
VPGPELPLRARRAVAHDLRRLALLWPLEDEGPPEIASLAFSAALDTLESHGRLRISCPSSAAVNIFRDGSLAGALDNG